VSRFKSIWILLCSALLASACATPNLATQVPSGFDLTGEWRLVADKSGSPPPHGSLRPPGRGGSRELARHGVEQDYPVITATLLDIEQNRDSMGIRYDRSEYRDVSWGKREIGMWTVDAGFSDGALYIVSRAHDSRATEIMNLSDDGNTLVVDIDVHAGENFTLRRVYRRYRSAL